MKLKLLIKTEMLKNKDFLNFQSLSGFVMLIYIKMPTIVGILIFTSTTDHA